MKHVKVIRPWKIWTVWLLTALGASFLVLSAFGRWGGASIDGDRVKWGLTGVDRLRGGPDVHIVESCRWRDGTVGLCSLRPSHAWAGPYFAVAPVVVSFLAAGAVLSGLLIASRPRISRWALLASCAMAVLVGLVSLVAAEGIKVYSENGVNAVGWGSLDWRFSIVLLGLAALIASTFAIETGRFTPCGKA
jgi:hypothetical protein